MILKSCPSLTVYNNNYSVVARTLRIQITVIHIKTIFPLNFKVNGVLVMLNLYFFKIKNIVCFQKKKILDIFVWRN